MTTLPFESAALSVREALAGKNVLLTGATGFVGKVWLAMMLEWLPEIGRIHVLVRGKGRTAIDRLERILNQSPAFQSLHRTQGDRLATLVAERVEAVEGDVGLPGLGLDDETAARLALEVDLVLNFAGLVEFNPDVREALAANVDGVANVLEFTRSCRRAALLQVSTCYVAGRRDGRIPEVVVDKVTPSGTSFDAERELEEIRAQIARVEAEQSSPEAISKIRDQVLQRNDERGFGKSEARVEAMVQRLARTQLKRALMDLGTRRADVLGWPNTYTYTKALGETLMVARAGSVPFTIVRPAIVESAIEYPFPGWNEGFNTCGPMVYLCGTWFRHVPAKTGNPFDVIPVDMVCRGITIAAAALSKGVHAPVYQCGSSDRNLFTIDRAVDLSGLGHRRHLRLGGETPKRRLLLSRWDVVVADPEHVLNIGNIRSFLRQSARFLRHGLPQKIPSELRSKADDLAASTDDTERRLRQIDEILELFQPFTHDQFAIFECKAFTRHALAEPEFRFEPEAIDWGKYWLDVHMPGLRKWCFPKYEGKESETDAYRAARPVVLQRPTEPRRDESTRRKGVG